MEQLLTIDIDTSDQQLAADIMSNGSEPKVGARIRLHDDLSIRFEGHYLRRLGNHPDTLSLLVSIQSEAVIISLVNYLFDRIDGRFAELRVNRKKVELSRDQALLAIGDALQK